MGRKPFVIAGPCSAESPAQVMDTARDLHAIGVNVFRAGIWKPRSHPGSFEGVGESGLEWLNEVRKTLGMRVCCEVATPEHVECCARSGMDMLWLGARTTANPFLVQEIAEALRGMKMTVLVKNPLSPDLELWIGAFERLNACGLTDLMGVLRGVTPTVVSSYRNEPAWELGVSLRGRVPEIPLLCDPSHIAGQARFVPELSQRAMNLGFDGLMIEVHNNPAEAKSDAMQQMSPAELSGMLDTLAIPDESFGDTELRESLVVLRSHIDAIDDELLSLLARRMEVSRQIGELKKSGDMAIVQPGRWNEVLSSMIEKGTTAGLSEAFIRRVFSTIHQESVAIQDRPMHLASAEDE